MYFEIAGWRRGKHQFQRERKVKQCFKKIAKGKTSDYAILKMHLTDVIMKL